MCLVGVLMVHTGNKPLAAHSIPTVYPQYTHSIPTVYPQYTYSIPKVYPQYTDNIPTVNPQYVIGRVEVLQATKPKPNNISF